MTRIDHALPAALDALGQQTDQAVLLSLGIGGRINAANACACLERFDWRGLLVEPSPELVERLRTSAAGRSGVTCEAVAVSTNDEDVDVLAMPREAIDRLGAPAGLAGLASLIPVRAATSSHSYRKLASDWGRLIRVPAVPLATLLERHAVNRVDVLQIDAGGYEWSIFNQFDFGRFLPAVVRVAWSYTPAGERIRMTRRLARHGYRVDSLPGELIALRPPAEPDRRDDQLPRVAVAPDGDVVLYVITYNAPEQLQHWLTSVELAAPELLELPRKFLLDNSTNEDTRGAYDRLATQHGFSLLRYGNLGISGGRYFCAKHFDALENAWGMLWFEDDMLLAGATAGVCRNGLPAHVPALVSRARAIVTNEGLDYLKLSFTEFFGDHHLNWAWYNLDQASRLRQFPDGTFRTRISHTGVEQGVSYLVGEVHYSNWPSLMTRRGNTELFLASPNPLCEQHYMVAAFQHLRNGRLRGGTLLASPIRHDRSVHYPADDRKEA
jgi:FkbM family methyltransferase